MRLTHLAGFDPDTLMPLSPNQIARREQIAAEMARVAKESESHLPADERRGAFVPGDDQIELRPVRAAIAEGASALCEMGIACAIATPVSVGLVLYQMMS